ncbi:MAG: single-stranded-DNA-specific exonuclease RecJ [Candidatus Gracilibacteria bacterium]|nr:single-stranded-DNA-specific exonuclease RecJ [Candidatus Gracilibacteria bacterium]
MQEKTSIKGNIIRYDEFSEFQDIEDILSSRFQNDELKKTLDDLYDPYLLKDMDKAVERIKIAKQKNQKVIIFGDYDVDGVTSTSILMHFFKKIGLQASYRLPNRITDGYGMKNYFMDELASIGVDLVITVDCGTRDIEVIKYAKGLGIDVIITDHHAVPEVIPSEAIAMINPKRLDCEYPFKYLSGAGVAFKLVIALSKEYFSKEESLKYLIETIDIAAIGTVADCMPLIDENRIIVLEGLKQIKNSRSNGIRKLIEEKIHNDLDADIFGFLIGPRLNAAGRLDSAYKAVNLILNNGNKIDEIIEDIENINNKRKDLTKIFTQDALGKIENKDNIIFYESLEIEHGIIGIVAGRLTETFHKPSIVLKDEGEKLVASCRSPEYFSIVEYLEKYKDYFLHFGGHKQAAGFSISKEKFGDFKKEFSIELNKLDFSKERKIINIDKIIKVEEFGFNLIEKIKSFKPFGIGNLKPIFMFKNFEIEKIEYLGKTMEHITIKNRYGINILGFGFGEYFEELKGLKKIDIIFDLMEDIWMGKKQLKAKVVDISI